MGARQPVRRRGGYEDRIGPPAQDGLGLIGSPICTGRHAGAMRRKLTAGAGMGIRTGYAAEDIDEVTLARQVVCAADHAALVRNESLVPSSLADPGRRRAPVQ